jgi:hypothetical protein
MRHGMGGLAIDSSANQYQYNSSMGGGGGDGEFAMHGKARSISDMYGEAKDPCLDSGAAGAGGGGDDEEEEARERVIRRGLSGGIEADAAAGVVPGLLRGISHLSEMTVENDDEDNSVVHAMLERKATYIADSPSNVLAQASMQAAIDNFNATRSIAGSGAGTGAGGAGGVGGLAASSSGSVGSAGSSGRARVNFSALNLTNGLAAFPEDYDSSGGGGAGGAGAGASGGKGLGLLSSGSSSKDGPGLAVNVVGAGSSSSGPASGLGLGLGLNMNFNTATPDSAVAAAAVGATGGVGGIGGVGGGRVGSEFGLGSTALSSHPAFMTGSGSSAGNRTHRASASNFRQRGTAGGGGVAGGSSASGGAHLIACCRLWPFSILYFTFSYFFFLLFYLFIVDIRFFVCFSPAFMLCW